MKDIFEQLFQEIKHGDQEHQDWLENKIKEFSKNLINKMDKTLNNTTANQAKDQVKDIKFWGEGDAWKLLGKASSINESWMKSSKAYEIEGVGCIVQVTTQQGSNVAEAVTFVPGVKIEETISSDNFKDNKNVISRKLVKI